MWNNIVEKNPEIWITSPGCGSFNPPVTFMVDTSIDAEKCQHEWNELGVNLDLIIYLTDMER